MTGHCGARSEQQTQVLAHLKRRGDEAVTSFAQSLCSANHFLLPARGPVAQVYGRQWPCRGICGPTATALACSLLAISRSAANAASSCSRGEDHEKRRSGCLRPHHSANGPVPSGRCGACGAGVRRKSIAVRAHARVAEPSPPSRPHPLPGLPGLLQLGQHIRSLRVLLE